MRASFLGKMLDRVGQLPRQDIQAYMARLTRENGLLERIFNTLHEGVVVLDANGRIDYMNKAAGRLLPIPSGAGVGSPISRFLRDVDWPRLLGESNAARREMEIGYPERRRLNFYLVPVDPADGEHDMFVAIFQDITERHANAQKELESEKLHALTLLAAGVAHELGNPLNNLTIHLQLMRRDMCGMEDPMATRLRESLEIADREIQRLDAIIHRFLRAVRPTLPELMPVNVRDEIQATLDLLQTEIDNRGLLVEIEANELLPDVEADAGQLKQAFYNVIRNALQAAPDRGILRISIRCDEGWLETAFRDNGSGVTPENLPRVAEPYFTTKSKGSGLGLMIVQRIVREHGGEMEIESDVGKGTQVLLRFPLKSRQVKLLPVRAHESA